MFGNFINCPVTINSDFSVSSSFGDELHWSGDVPGYNCTVTRGGMAAVLHKMESVVLCVIRQEIHILLASSQLAMGN